ncbi:MAG: CRISPR-associated protein Cas5 [Kiritimatiellia bacterium]
MKRYPIKMEIAGSTAMWTRPDTGDCPVSYPAPTYSAVRNIFQSILWGQAVEIIPTQVDICAPLQFHTYNTNYGGPLRKSGVVKSGGGYQLLATVLTNVRYRLFADVVEVPPSESESVRTREWRKSTKSPGHAYQEIFDRRLVSGKCFHTPFLGWKEFVASYFGPLRVETRPVDITTVLPSMFCKAIYGADGKVLRYEFDQNVRIEHGSLRFSSAQQESKYA